MARGEEEREFEREFDRLFDRAFRLARRIVDDDGAAEDVAAESLARAYARWATVRKLPWRDGWVLRVAANLAIDVTRSRRRETGSIPAPQVDIAEGVVERFALLFALRSLPRRQREALVLRYLGGFSEADVALALGVAQGTVKSHLHRGATTLRRRLGPTFRCTDGPSEVSLANPRA